MTARAFTTDAILSLGALWALYLLVSGIRDGWRHRRRTWWREPKRGDYIDLRRKL